VVSDMTEKKTAQILNQEQEMAHPGSSAGATPGKPAASTGITPEIMAVIEEAASAFVGREVRILSVKLASEPRVESNSWADQGRAVLQASHNLVQRGH